MCRDALLDLMRLNFICVYLASSKIRKIRSLQIAAPIEHIRRQRTLFAQQSIEPHVKTGEPVAHYAGVIHLHGTGLADAIGAGGGLVFFGRVPGAGEVDDVVGRLNIHAKANGQGRQDDHVETYFLLKSVN